MGVSTMPGNSGSSNLGTNMSTVSTGSGNKQTGGFHGYAPYAAAVIGKSTTTPKATVNTTTTDGIITASKITTKPTPTKPVSDLALRRSQSNKVATSNLFIVDERTVTAEEMTDLLFEDFGATELINLSRHDSLNGQSIIYQPIKNMSALALDYNPQNILSFGQTENDLIQNFLLNVEKYIPSQPLSVDGQSKVAADEDRIVYLDQITNDIIIEVVNIGEDERVEVEFLTYATLEDDTIYIT